MGTGFTRRQKKDRQSYANQIFTNRDEYFYYRDLRTLIMEILQSGNRKSMDNQTRNFLLTCHQLIEKCKRDNRHCDWKCYGSILVMESMRDSEQFQTEYKSLKTLLSKRMESCDKKTNPAEQIMTDEEIRLVLLEKPWLIDRCAKPSYAAQFMACKRYPRAISLIDNPTAELVDMVVERHVKNILLVQPQFRTLKSEVAALLADVLNLRQINKQRLVEHDYNADEYWTNEDLIKLVCKIEEEYKNLTTEQFATFRLNAANWDQVCTIQYMRGPDKSVKERAVQAHPFCISDIKHQYPELQKLALFSGFQIECKNIDFGTRRSKMFLSLIFNRFVNPDEEVVKIYQYLVGLHNNLSLCTEIVYQNEFVHMGCLHLARAKKIDVNRVFSMFQNPSIKVTDFYKQILEQQIADAYHTQKQHMKDLSDVTNDLTR